MQRSRFRSGKPSYARKREIPWVLIGAVLMVVTLVAAIGTVLWRESAQTRAARDLQAKRSAANAEWQPTDQRPDPTNDIPGVTKRLFPAGMHVSSTQRVAYDVSPPLGGPHDSSWAACNGVVYKTSVRTENMVHALEHGAVWIAYRPGIPQEQVDDLAARVTAQPYMVMSPYPGLESNISVQSWGHQIKSDRSGDANIDRFIAATLLNSKQGVYPEDPSATGYPEVGATCDNPYFNVSSPPAYDPTPPGPGSVPMDGTGGSDASREEMPMN